MTGRYFSKLKASCSLSRLSLGSGCKAIKSSRNRRRGKREWQSIRRRRSRRNIRQLRLLCGPKILALRTQRETCSTEYAVAAAHFRFWNATAPACHLGRSRDSAQRVSNADAEAFHAPRYVWPAGRFRRRPGAPEQEAPPFLPGVYLVLLTKSPEELPKTKCLLRQLCSSIEVLTELAAPANVSSIYLTSAFLRDETSSIASVEARSAARRLRRWATITAILGLLFFCFAVMLLMHVDRGRREIQQLEQVREEYRLVIASLDQRHDADQIALCTKDLSSPQPQSSVSYQPWCERLRDVVQRMDIASRGLGAWNIVSYRLADVFPIRWLGARQPCQQIFPRSDGTRANCALRR